MPKITTIFSRIEALWVGATLLLSGAASFFYAIATRYVDVYSASLDIALLGLIVILSVTVVARMKRSVQWRLCVSLIVGFAASIIAFMVILNTVCSLFEDCL